MSNIENINSDSDNESITDNKSKIYTILELNKILTKKCYEIIDTFPLIHLHGEIRDYKIFKNNCGGGFKIVDNNASFNCKVWKNSEINLNIINNYENTICEVIGRIKPNYFYSHEFVLEVINIKNINNNSKSKKLK